MNNSKRKSKKEIPFNSLRFAGKELEYITKAVRSGWIGGNGFYTRKCNAWMERTFKAKKVLLTNSATAALEVAAILCDIKPGDEIILPSYTFVSTANAFVLRGARPVFVDIRSDTLNMDESLLEEAITRRTKVIVPVHYAGVSCEMSVILRLASKYKLFVVEDAAQGVLCSYRDKTLGTIGDLGVVSFHETKNFTCGEGGALLINRSQYSQRAEVVVEKGTNRKEFYQGRISQYTWIDQGGSYLPSDIVAAFLYAQLQKAQEIRRKRLLIWNRYKRGLSDLAKKGCLRIPTVPTGCRHNGHMFYVILPTVQERTGLSKFLEKHGIQSVFHYTPLHASPMGKKLGVTKGKLTVTEFVASRILRLPLFYDLTLVQQDKIIACIHRWFKRC